MVNGQIYSDKSKNTETNRSEEQLSQEGLSIDDLSSADFSYDKSALGITGGNSNTNTIQKKGGDSTEQESQMIEEEEPLQMKGGKDKEEDKPLQFKSEEEPLQMKGGDSTEQESQMVEEEEPLQMKGGKDKEEDKPLQFKEGGSRQVSAGKDTVGSTLPAELRAKMENSFGTDFSNVKIHTDSANASQVGALAYTQGNEIHFAPGQYQPDSKKGQELLGHELTHVVQQRNGRVEPTTQAAGKAVNDSPELENEADVMGAKAAKGESVPMNATNTSNPGNVIQGYFSTTKGSSSYRVADDLSTAVKEGYPNHALYAQTGKVATANASLKAANSGIELVESATERTFTNGKKTEKLRLVSPKNKTNGTAGSNMKLWADCGKSNSVVVGGTNRKAAFNNGGVTSWTTSSNPSGMKAEIMKTWLTKKYADVSTSAPVKLKIKTALDGAKVLETQMNNLLNKYSTAKTEAERDVLAEMYLSAVDQWAEKLWSYYYGLDSISQSSIDKELGINRYAKPKVGEGYTTSTGGSPIAGQSTWNFHWGGVVMESNDATDKVVLENYAVGDASVENNDWEFAMYGTSKKGQTFHDQHKDTKQHGTNPTTMRIDNK